MKKRRKRQESKQRGENRYLSDWCAPLLLDRIRINNTRTQINSKSFGRQGKNIKSRKSTGRISILFYYWHVFENR